MPLATVADIPSSSSVVPFLTLMLAGRFFLTPATALLYEKVTQISKTEALNVEKNKRKSRKEE